MAFKPIYRAWIARPRSQNRPGETEPLYPAAGAPHGDPFAVASAAGVTMDLNGLPVECRPYLDVLPGRRGVLNVRAKKVDVGELVLRLLDKRRDPASNDERWVTAFVGDGEGPRLKGCLVRVEESLDGGVTWHAFWTGRVHDVSTAGAAVLTLVVRDLSDDLDLDVFVGLPHASITYAFQSTYAPVGLIRRYGNIAPTRWLRGSTHAGGFAHGNRRNRHASFYKPLHALADEVQEVRLSLQGMLRARYDRGKALVLARTPGSATVYRFHLRSVVAVVADRTTDKIYRITQADVEPIEPGALGYRALWPAGADIEWAIVPIRGPVEACPLFIDGVHPVQLWKDLLDGKYHFLDETGAVMRTVRYHAAKFAALLADPSFPLVRARIAKPMKLVQFIEQYILRPCQLAYLLNAAGEVEPIDLRLANALTPSVAVDDDALDEARDAFRWGVRGQDAIRTIESEFAVDTQMDWESEKLGAAGIIPELPCSLTTERTIPFIIDDDRPATADTSGNTVTLKAPSLRCTVNEAGEQFARLDVEAAVRAAVRDEMQPYARGGTEFVTRCVRDRVTGVAVGTFATAGFSRLVNPTTLVRGGTRLALCLDRLEDGPIVELAWLDLGPAAAAEPPTLSDLAVADPDVPTVTVTVARNAAGDPVVLDIAERDPVLAETDPLALPTTAWRRRVAIATTDGPVVLPATGGFRVFVRGVSQPIGAQASAPASPAAPAFVDVGGVPAPAGVAVSAIGPTTATVGWTPSATYRTEVLLAYGTGIPVAAAALMVTLPAGAASHVLSGLAVDTAYTVHVRHVAPVTPAAPVTARGASVAVPFSTAAVVGAATFARPAGVAVGTGGASGEGGEGSAAGIVITLFPSDAAAEFAIERAPDDGAGAPDVGAAELLGADFPAGLSAVFDPRPLDGARWHYRIAHAAGNQVASPSTCWRDAVPAVVAVSPSPASVVLPSLQASQTTTTSLGTLTLGEIDPQCRRVSVQAKTRVGTSAETAFAPLVLGAVTPNAYVATVAIVAGQGSSITVRETFRDADGVERTRDTVFPFSGTTPPPPAARALTFPELGVDGMPLAVGERPARVWVDFPCSITDWAISVGDDDAAPASAIICKVETAPEADALVWSELFASERMTLGAGHESDAFELTTPVALTGGRWLRLSPVTVDGVTEIVHGALTLLPS